MISNCLLKLCSKSIFKLLDLIFQSCIKQGKFPTEWKKANVAPVHKKGDKQILKNYWPVSLLPICGKSFDHLIYNNIFKYFIENDLTSQNQTGFKPGNSCISQLIPITHEIYQSFDDELEVRGVFLDISKAFHKVWGLIYKLKQKGVKGNLLETLTNFFKLQETKRSFKRSTLKMGKNWSRCLSRFNYQK